ncbi:unnamed protein product [Gongylonema pulchrum]|uniref:DUF4347 domain-containing protein n=1 Tax=Gongylonema pulchrum TaxID=637853 RepID=A0A183DPZ2_9BILA|nr:unnamed protein product [Gongylonema pulchrum]
MMKNCIILVIDDGEQYDCVTKGTALLGFGDFEKAACPAELPGLLLVLDEDQGSNILSTRHFLDSFPSYPETAKFPTLIFSTLQILDVAPTLVFSTLSRLNFPTLSPDFTSRRHLST